MTTEADAGRIGVAVAPVRPPLDPAADSTMLLADIAESLRRVVAHLDHAEHASRGALEILGNVSRSKRFRALVGSNGN